MPSAEQQLKYWQSRAHRAEQLLKSEERFNGFTISWLKRNFPEMHRQLHACYTMNSVTKISSLQRRVHHG